MKEWPLTCDDEPSGDGPLAEWVTRHAMVITAVSDHYGTKQQVTAALPHTVLVGRDAHAILGPRVGGQREGTGHAG